MSGHAEKHLEVTSWVLSFQTFGTWRNEEEAKRREEGWREELMDVAVNPQTLSLFLFVYRR